MNRRARPFIEVTVSVAIVIVSIGLRVVPSIVEVEPPPQEVAVLEDIVTTELDSRFASLPLPERIVTQEERYDTTQHRGEIAWLVSDEELPLLCGALEKRRPPTAYTVQTAGNDRWSVRGTFDSAAQNDDTVVRDSSWIDRLSPLFVHDPPSDPPPDERSSVPIDEGVPPTPASGGSGGSGGVRFEGRGAMQWLWDDTVLRLEPVR